MLTIIAGVIAFLVLWLMVSVAVGLLIGPWLRRCRRRQTKDPGSEGTAGWDIRDLTGEQSEDPQP